jgi:protein TonB
MRLTAAILLSVALHLVLLTVLPAPRTRDDREIIRVSLLKAQEPAPKTSKNPPLSPPRPQKANQPPVKKKDAPREPQKKEKKEPAEKPPVEPAAKTREKTEETIEEFYPEPAEEVSDVELFGTDQPGQPKSHGSPVTDAQDGAGPAIVDISNLAVTKKIQPQYPMISRKRRDQGTVTLLVTIKAGRVASIEVERSSGHGPLDESAVRAVREWEFDSSGYGDTVVARIPFAFSLQ